MAAEGGPDAAPVQGRIDVVTIFPDYLAPLDLSLVGKARREGRVRIDVHDLRHWAHDRHRSVDDTPAGGGAGMVMRPDVWGEALDSIFDAPDASVVPGPPDASVVPGPPDASVVPESPAPVLLIPTPAGEPLVQRTVEDLARRLTAGSRLVIACGRYEGIDARVAEHYARSGHVDVREISLGDYVLNGGEAAALVVVESVVRLLPGVLGNPGSLDEESHGVAGLLEGPVYTRPLDWRDLAVPDVLRSGHHERIRRWRRDEALERTARRRPDLLSRVAASGLDEADRRTLATLGWQVRDGRLVPAADTVSRS